MSDARRLFERQLAKATYAGDQLDTELLTSLVVQAYEDYGRDRARTDRSIILMAEENDALAEELRASVHKLAIQNGRFEAALENMPHGLSMFDERNRIVVSNRRLREIYDLTSADVAPGASMTGIFGADLAVRFIESAPGATFRSRSGEHSPNCSWSLANGRVIDVAISRLKSGGWVAVHNDVTEQKCAEARIAHMANHDALTGLANRLLFRTELENKLERLAVDQPMAILYLDLDHFKAVNDTLGHPFGDKLLQRVSEALKSCVSMGDIVARLGGDEFAIIQASDMQPAASASLASRVLEELSQDLVIDGHQVSAATSIGIAVAPFDGKDADQLLKNADMALYRAKADGRNVFRYFEPAMDAKLQARRELELDLRDAIANEQLEVFYQPLIDVSTNTITCFEALLRWNHPLRGRVSPCEFIPIAEETGLIHSIGDWVLRRACADATGWPPTITVAVNVSPVQFRAKSLALNIAAALGHFGLSPSRLELEITEAVFLQDTPQTLDILHHIKGLGVSVAMDDFGTGYSSLSYLRSFPFDKMKIDQSFVRDIDDNPDALAIIRAITGLGRSLGIRTTVEGVETDPQLQAVRAEGCNEVQGFLISRPLPVAEIPNILNRLHNNTVAARAVA